ncbi:Geranylgeranyl pyrophosphate synthase 4 [Candidatus Clavichlamydia salmonicola]|uniref:polyprenyl synthetase family protein n=1 Tax=Candidatus Clavichlamydia salmonicola TaxID=469812 RepID=UPI0018918328|nr:polyprenyl synthetase family protein [Candidatus Clavichlamydia salmonicola]MBF5050630.1 Geranylgeranyl pyrophosphate synthase 4 [Candidatus Clavichlamydia salmonicola]
MKKATKIVFKNYISLINKNIDKSLATFGAPGIGLRPAIEYALNSGGKRIRPLIIHMMTKALKNIHPIEHVAVAVEWVHTATLIADDLPCMDNDDRRRNKPSLHKAFNEGTALLVTYALIAAAYDNLRVNAQILHALIPSEKTTQAYFLSVENVAYNTGAFGLAGGQFDDIFSKNSHQDFCDTVIKRKTGALFEMTFVLGWLFGGGDIEFLPLLKEASTHFGKVFQIVDDILDISSDALNVKKENFNFAQTFGLNSAKDQVYKEAENFKRMLKELNINNNEFFQLMDYVTEQI